MEEAEEAPLVLKQEDGHQDIQKVLHKVHKWLLPFGFFIVCICYMDRGNIGFAANTFCADLNLTAAEYGTGAGLFYAGYSLFQLPSNIILHYVGAPTWLGSIMILWGVLASSMAFVRTSTQFYILRFALGIAESGTFPGLWYYFSMFYPEKYITFPLSILELSLVLSAPASVPVAMALLSLDGLGGLGGWQWLFLAEGVVPIIIGISLFFVWSKNPRAAHFLTSAEKQCLEDELRQDRKVLSSDSDLPFLRSIANQLLTILKSWGFFHVTLAAFIRDIGMNVVLYFTTIFVQGMLVHTNKHVEQETEDHPHKGCSVSKTTNFTAVALSAVPFIVAGISLYGLALVAQRMGNRPIPGGVTVLISSAFFAAFPLFAQGGIVWGFLAYCLGVISCYAAQPLIIGLAISFMPPKSRPIGLALFNTLAMLGALIGPIITGHVADHDAHLGSFQKYSRVVLWIGMGLGLGGVVTLCIRDPLTARAKETILKEENEPPVDRGGHP